MKLLVVLVALTALCAGSTIPLVPKDNSHYVPGESRYIWMPDGDDGAPVLVDLQAPVEKSDTSRSGFFNQYRLFTSYQLLIHGNVNSVRNSNFNGNQPTLVIAHGWRSSGGSAWVTQIKNAYLDWTNGNVIVVDWSSEASDINYIAVARLVPAVGRRTKEVLNFIINTSGSNWNRFHLIGHSLGAHVVGTAGRAPGGRPDRVTGLDPAGPQFGKFMANSLGMDSGTYVESIHTQRGIGIGIDISHADFFPNGGNNQPGCNGMDCDQRSVPQLFAASIGRTHLVGRRCSSLQQAHNRQCAGTTFVLGTANLGKRGFGIYGLNTGASWPF